MPTIDTRFHGTLTIEESDILTTDYPILGFSSERQFVLLPHEADSPFLYLQSLATPTLAFICIDPLLRVADYTVPRQDIPADLGDSTLWAILCLCTVGQGRHASVNLRSPLIFNRQTRHGGQFVLSLPYPLHYPLFSTEGTVREAPSSAGTHP